MNWIHAIYEVLWTSNFTWRDSLKEYLVKYFLKDLRSTNNARSMSKFCTYCYKKKKNFSDSSDKSNCTMYIFFLNGKATYCNKTLLDDHKN